jgi:hypothetical protein
MTIANVWHIHKDIFWLFYKRHISIYMKTELRYNSNRDSAHNIFSNQLRLSHYNQWYMSFVKQPENVFVNVPNVGNGHATIGCHDLLQLT